MKKMVLFAAMILATGLCVGQKPPVVSDAMRAKLWRAQSDVQLAQIGQQKANDAVQKAQDGMTKVMAEWAAACGKDFQPGMDKDGEPGCIAKTEVKK
jgi:hypothetical protein